MSHPYYDAKINVYPPADWDPLPEDEDDVIEVLDEVMMGASNMIESFVNGRLGEGWRVVIA